ncbi:hypothetical protein B0I35DRAFT_441476 [Stachybotrys elegans]|uniref:Uncharacterized protein n=1 Tax=Stachybotrys elegans TaxID=80388 RepID=A0A8K0SLV8_9HYPO|nr:hypothetical protein B0I35DRAFT_441476 [Stachybotrys elegans]
MPPAEGFEGDEFSNNLFSDLAPLLTLFGEQVTKQFLTMSMSWEDNILLAMGPLGIITIIVSAIRVGGGKGLKTLIGRARESRSVVEQELLSSTSENVCELWNGQEIVRLVGSWDETSTLVVDQNGDVSEMAHAWCDGRLEYSDHLRTELYVKSLTQRAPNIALNVSGSTVSMGILRTWTAIGLLVQMFAMAFPGIATYQQGWDKAGVPVAEYAYPCFLLGTVCLAIGLLLCGHIIEGATTERMFWVTEEGWKDGLMFFVLQQKKSVGDLQFPFCIILPAMDDGKFRLSSLNNNDYRNLATISTIFAIVGYVVQFVGLRALHWSASIVQLGVTVIMTAIRAGVRQSLAKDPVSSVPWEGHEEAWLTQIVLSARERRKGVDCGPRDTTNANFMQRARVHCSKILQQAKGSLSNRHELTLGFGEESYFWEIIWQPCASDVGGFMQNHYRPICSFLQVGLYQSPASNEDAREPANEPVLASPPHVYSRISDCIRSERTGTYVDMDELSSVSQALCTAIEHTMGILCQDDAVMWKQPIGSMLKTSEQGGASSMKLQWTFNVRYGSARDYHQPQTTQNRFCLNIEGLQNSGPRADVANPHTWRVDHDLIQAAIGLSVYTNAVRDALRNGRQDKPDGPRPRHYRPYKKDIRIIGYERENGNSSSHFSYEKIKQWLKDEIAVAIHSKPRPQLFREGDWNSNSIFGLFLSSLTDDDSSCLESPSADECREVYIERVGYYTATVRFAQELFSLFMLGVASNIDGVKGDMTSLCDTTDGLPGIKRMSNSIFTSISRALINEKLVEDVGEAEVLIIPAFAKYNLLPTKETEGSPEEHAEVRG